MNTALEATPKMAPVLETLRKYFIDTAHFLQNAE